MNLLLWLENKARNQCPSQSILSHRWISRPFQSYGAYFSDAEPFGCSVISFLRTNQAETTLLPLTHFSLHKKRKKKIKQNPNFKLNSLLARFISKSNLVLTQIVFHQTLILHLQICDLSVPPNHGEGGERTGHSEKWRRNRRRRTHRARSVSSAWVLRLHSESSVFLFVGLSQNSILGNEFWEGCDFNLQLNGGV